MKQFKKLFEAHFKTTFREKQVWFWSIVYPVLLLVIFLTIFGGASKDEDSFSAKIALVKSEEGQLSQQMTAVLKQIPVLEWKDDNPVPLETAEQWLKKKEIDAAVIIPDGQTSKQVELIFNREKEQSTLTQVTSNIVSQVITQMEFQQSGIVPDIGLKTTFVSAGSESLTFVDFLLTGLIALAISQAGMFGMISMVEMRRNGLLKRLKLTPVSMGMYGLGNMIVRFVLSGIQVVLLSLIGVFGYGASLHIDIATFILMFTVGTVSFAALGYLIASVSKSMDSYFGIANLASFIMMFLSGIFFEFSLLPDYIKPIANAIPLTYFVNGIRDSMVYGFSIVEPEFWLNLGVLAAWGVATFMLASWLYGRKAEVR